MTDIRYLMTPGPVETPNNALRAASRPLISHRSVEFRKLFLDIQIKLSKLFKTEGNFVILPCSGTGTLECMAQNFLTNDDSFISVSCGAFGNRFRKISERTGAQGIYLDTQWGEAARPEAVSILLKAHPDCRCILLTQNETSTGIVNPVREIVAALPEKNRPFVLVDGVSACGAMESFPAEWGIDAIGTASQKGLLTAPGLGIIWLSERAWNYIENRECHSYYFDLKLQKKFLKPGSPENPYTPPISLYYELNETLDEILLYGIEKWFSDRKRYARALAAGLEALGFELLVKDPQRRSPGVTAFSINGQNTEDIRKKLRKNGIETAGGQDQFKGKLIRVAHYNNWGWPELCVLLGGLYAATEEKLTNGRDFMSAAWKEWNQEE